MAYAEQPGPDPRLPEIPRRGPANGLATLRWPVPSIVAVGLGGALVVGAGAAFHPLAGFAALLAVAGGLMALARPDVGALTLVALVPIASGLQRGVPVPGLRVSEVLIVGIAAIVLLAADRRDVPAWRTFDWLAFLYVVGTAAVGAYGLASRGGEFNAENVGTLVGPLQFFLLYRAVLVGLNTAEQRRLALKLLLLASIPVVVLGLLQQADVAGIRPFLIGIHGADLTQDYSYQQLARATGPFPHWQVFGAYVLIITLLALALRLEREDRVIGPAGGGAVIVLGIAGVLATLTVAPVLALSVGALVLGWWAKRLNRIFGILVVSGVVGALVLGSQITSRYELQFAPSQQTGRPALVPQTIAYRWDHWTNELLPALSGRWLTGYGPDLPASVAFRFTESLYVEFLFRGGLVLLAMYAFLTWALASQALRRARAPGPEDRAVARVVVVMVALLVFMHLIEPYFITTGMPHVLWVLAALLLGAQGSDAARQASDARAVSA
jgi:hypothetical protein